LQSKVIAFHYGSNTFSLMPNDSAFSASGASGPELFLVWLTNDFSSLKEFGCLAGSPNSPIYSSNPGRLNSMPANGKYYRFAPNAQTSIRSVHSTPSLDIYPNPASEGVFRIKSDAKPISAYTVYDVNGRIMTEKTIQTPLTSVDVELNIPKQLYWIQILLSDGTSIHRKLQIE
jgi:Secretion system C-terminal sorting domain